ncbi:hypothetical protein [Alistipes finegoldii]|uniref:hypothetical protein n=1 Tax=Alistipes finegoldii TaxID=214856 RepID=UPI0025B76AD0|nr:hypothetical protein [Alistipes finegoldii]
MYQPSILTAGLFSRREYVSMWMYESEASELIWQLLYACIGAYEVEKEYSAELKEGGEGDTR